MGVRNLSADLTHTTGGTSTVVVFNCYECWIQGIRSIDAARNHFYLYVAARNIVRDNYIYQNTNHLAESYGIESYWAGSDDLIENNICQQVTDSCPSNTGGGAGNVASYNFAIMDIFGGTNWFQPSDFEHATGYGYWLREGNVALGLELDQIHGTHNFTTAFRNRYSGWQSAGCDDGAALNQCAGNTSAVLLFAASRYMNLIGNVWGQAGYDTNYKCLGAASQTCGQNQSVLYIGASPNGYGTGVFCANAACTSTTSSYDPLTINSLMLWGNWDNVTNAVRWCGNSSDPGWSTTCSSTSEIPSGFGDKTGTLSTYVNPVPSSTDLPASFVYSSKPSWWGSLRWPGIGPDVTGGNMGICSGGTYANSYVTSGSQCTGGGTMVTAFGGHANANPAMNCYLNVMNGTPDGTGNVLPFDANSCYGGSGNGGGSGSIVPPTTLTTVAR